LVVFIRPIAANRGLWHNFLSVPNAPNLKPRVTQ